MPDQPNPEWFPISRTWHGSRRSRLGDLDAVATIISMRSTRYIRDTDPYTRRAEGTPATVATFETPAEGYWPRGGSYSVVDSLYVWYRAQHRYDATTTPKSS